LGQALADKSKLETAEMRFLRHVAGCTRRDEMSNLTIRSELQIFNIIDKIRDQKKKWHDHIQRMDPYRIARKAVEYTRKPIGHRDSDAQREDGRMTFEDSYMIGTDLMVYHDDDDEYSCCYYDLI
jgi:hypothetical protein